MDFLAKTNIFCGKRHIFVQKWPLALWLEKRWSASGLSAHRNVFFSRGEGSRCCNPVTLQEFTVRSGVGSRVRGSKHGTAGQSMARLNKLPSREKNKATTSFNLLELEGPPPVANGGVMPLKVGNENYQGYTCPKNIKIKKQKTTCFTIASWDRGMHPIKW